MLRRVFKHLRVPNNHNLPNTAGLPIFFSREPLYREVERRFITQEDVPRGSNDHPLWLGVQLGDHTRRISRPTHRQIYLTVGRIVRPERQFLKVRSGADSGLGDQASDWSHHLVQAAAPHRNQSRVISDIQDRGFPPGLSHRNCVSSWWRWSPEAHEIKSLVGRDPVVHLCPAPRLRVRRRNPDMVEDLRLRFERMRDLAFTVIPASVWMSRTRAELSFNATFRNKGRLISHYRDLVYACMSKTRYPEQDLATVR